MKNIIIIILLCVIPDFLHSQWETQISGTTGNLRTIYFLNPVTSGGNPEDVFED